jgi:arsenite methyltransferase
VKKAIVPVGDYGIDEPRVVRALGQVGVGFLALTVVAAIANVIWLMGVAFGLTIVVALAALVLVRSSRVSKIRERVRVFDQLGLDGDERVLDAGCDRGLLLVEAARRVPDGMAVGVDSWSTKGDPGVTADVPLHNAEIEGVLHQVEVHTADLRKLPFDDASFDVAVSSMTLRSLHTPEARVQAIREIDRVLKPGGKLVLVDLQHTKAYAHALRACDWTDVRRSGPVWRMIPPVRYVRGTKPSAKPPNQAAKSTSDESTTSAPASESSDSDAGPDATPTETTPAESAPATSEAVSPT